MLTTKEVQFYYLYWQQPSADLRPITSCIIMSETLDTQHLDQPEHLADRAVTTIHGKASVQYQNASQARHTPLNPSAKGTPRSEKFAERFRDQVALNKENQQRAAAQKKAQDDSEVGMHPGFDQEITPEYQGLEQLNKSIPDTQGEGKGDGTRRT
jgi:hypothetical protein